MTVDADAALQAEVNLVAEAIDKYGSSREKLLPVLGYIRDRNKYLSTEIMREVAARFDLSAAEVYGVASFYHFLPTTVKGENMISVCKTIVCDMHGKGEILRTIRDMLKIGLNETTEDRKFSLQAVNCIGCCDTAPAILVNDKPYSQLDPAKTREIIKSYRD